MKHIKTGHSDIPPNVWFDHWLPKFVLVYTRLARFDRPIGAWLLFIPALWSIGLAALWSPQTDLIHAVRLGLLFLLGALIMRGAGCVINDLWDQDLDSKVERTAGRPLASGSVTRQAALIFLFILLASAFCLVATMPLITLGLAVLSLLPIVLYPLAKRITHWPQAVLGLTFNFGAVMGASAVVSDLPGFVWPLYIGCFFWTIGYDTIYAHQDRDDDLSVGIKSTALLFGEHTHSALRLLYAFALCFWGIALVMSFAGPLSWLGLFAAALTMVKQIRTLDIHDPRGCLALFKFTALTGWAFALGIFLDGFLSA